MKRIFEVHRWHTGDIHSEIEFPQTDDLEKWCHDRIVALRIDLLITDENENPIKEITVQDVMSNVTYHDVKVFQLEENTVGAGKLLWEGKAPVRPDGQFDKAFAERCRRRVARDNRTIRVESETTPHRFYFYVESWGLTHMLPKLEIHRITRGFRNADNTGLACFDRRQKKSKQFIGYVNEGRYGFYFTKEVYQNIIFKGKHPKLNSQEAAMDWVIANAIGWKTY